MFKSFYEAKKNRYKDTIMKLFELPDSEFKTNELSTLLTEYGKFCYDHDLEAFTYDEKSILENKGYVIPSEPIIYEIDEEKVALASTHLKEALETGSGITEEEAQELLKWSVAKARDVFASEGTDINHCSLSGMCGYGQTLTLLPFANIGANITINNVHYFPFTNNWHAFGSVELPINRGDTIVRERFLVDSTYRQFFPIINNTAGNYYNSDRRHKDKVGPDAAYYLAQYPGGLEFASELLQKGFIKLEPGMLKMYGVGFVADSLNITNRQNLQEIFKLKEDLFVESLLKSESSFDFEPEEIEELSKIVNFPELNLQR